MTAAKSTRAKANAHSRPVRSGLEILAGALPPVDVNLRVRLTSGDTQHHPLPAQLSPLLDTHRPAIEAWLTRNQENPYLLLTDPLAALRSAGVKLPPDVAANLERTRGRASAGEVLPAGVRLAGIAVTMAKASTSGAGDAAGRSTSRARERKR